MPIKNQGNRMQAVVQAIAQYHPSFPDKLKGCNPTEIAKLQATVGRPLPLCYVEYLQLMGHSTGDLELYGRADFSFNSVLEYHTLKDIPRPPERYLLFGIEPDDPYADFYLDCGTPEHQVIRFETPETAEEFPKVIRQHDWLASSLYEFVFSKAFATFHLSHFPHEGALAEDPQNPVKIEQAESILKMLGFIHHPQSTTAAIYYERPTAVVILSRYLGPVGSPIVSLGITVAAFDRREMLKVSDILEKRLRLRIAR